MTRLSYIVAIHMDTDNNRSASTFRDWVDMYQWVGVDLDPDLVGAFEVDDSDNAKWFTRDDVEEFMDTERREADAEQRRNDGLWAYYHGGRG